MHHEAWHAVERMAESVIEAGTVFTGSFGLDIGGQQINGDARSVFGPLVRWQILDATNEYDPGVDIVADARTWRDPDAEGMYDIVLSTELLEHCERWHEVLDTAAFCLRDDGWLFLTCAAHTRPAHGAFGDPLPAPGEFYEGVRPERLRFEVGRRVEFDFGEVEYNPNPGDCYLLARRAPR